MTNKNDALPVVAWEAAEDLVLEAMRKGFGIHRLLDGGLCIDDTQVGVEFALEQLKPIFAARDAELAELRNQNTLLHDAGQRVDDHYQAIIGQLQAELAALRERVTKYEAELVKISDGVQFWNDGAPPSTYGSEWFIARLKDGGRAVLRELPEEYSHDYTTADGTYYTKDWVVRWAQFPDSDYLLYAAPLVSDKAGAVDERAAFEQWFGGNLDENNYAKARDDFGFPFYAHEPTRRAWNAWQARAALNPLAADVAPRPTGLSQGWNLVRQQDGYVIGHSHEEPAEHRKQAALKENRVYVPFMIAADVAQGGEVEQIQAELSNKKAEANHLHEMLGTLVQAAYYWAIEDEDTAIQLSYEWSQRWYKMQADLATQTARADAAERLLRDAQSIAAAQEWCAANEATPAEFLAYTLLVKRCEVLGRPLTWAESIELSGLSDEEKARLLALDDEPVAADVVQVPKGWRLVPVEQLLNLMSDKDRETRINAERQMLALLATRQEGSKV